MIRLDYIGLDTLFFNDNLVNRILSAQLFNGRCSWMFYDVLTPCARDIIDFDPVPFAVGKYPNLIPFFVT